MKLIYVYDALCGWCYGFSAVMNRIYEKYRGQIPIEVISGGMVTGDREGMIDAQTASYILKTIPRVEEYTGVRFGEAYTEKIKAGTYYQSSLKPAIALAVFRTHVPDEALLFASAIQNAQFRDGKDLQLDQTYLDLVATTPVDANLYQKQLASEEFAYAAQQEFTFAQQLGITGFPALLAEKEDKYYLLSRGYQPYESLEPVIEKIHSA